MDRARGPHGRRLLRDHTRSYGGAPLDDRRPDAGLGRAIRPQSRSSIARANARVPAVPPRSRVRIPAAYVASRALRIRFAASPWPKWSSIMIAETRSAVGLARSFP